MLIVVGKKGEQIIVDTLDYEKANSYKWYAAHSKKGFTQISTRINGKKVSFSTIVFGLSKDQRLLHKYGNSFDFSRENILICNNSEFMHYIMKQSGESSKYFGVYFNKRFQGWKVSTRKCGKKIDSGGYLQEEEAARDYDIKVLELFGEYAKLN